jgi:hypothetical protein
MTSSRGAGRKVAVALLWTVTALLVLLGVLIAVSGATSAGLVFIFLLAVLTGSAATTVARVGRGSGAGPRRATARALPSAAMESFAATAAGADEADSLAGLPAIDPRARYTERHSQFPVVGGPVALALLGGSVAAAAIVGGAAVGFALPIAIISGLFGCYVLADLPNGIKVSDGTFTVGVLSMPPRTRLWRRISGPLAAVRSWDVLTPAQVRELNRRRPTKGRSGQQLQYLGDLRMLGRRGVLRLVTEPGSVDARFPASLLRGYLLLPTALAGGVWDGVILICTRRPAALAAALEQALPGRRAR